MAPKRNTPYSAVTSLLHNALAYLERGDRTDALDSIRMAQRKLREASPPGIINWLPKQREATILSSVEPACAVITFERAVTPLDLRVIQYELNQLREP